MLKRLQPFMQESNVYKDIFSANANAIDSRGEIVDDIKLQQVIDMATWALEYYEVELGIKVNISKPYSERRSMIKAALRGNGIFTSALIKNIVSSWTGGTVEVTFTNSMISIKFIDTIGIPANMDDVELVLDDVKPAHLGFTFEYTFNSNAVISNFTHVQLAAYTHEQLRSEAI